MTKKQELPSYNPEQHPLWQKACELAEQLYGLLDEFPEDEKWASRSKLQTGVIDLVFYIGRAAASGNPYGSDYDWGNALRAAGSVKTVYRFAGRQKFFKIDPELMVGIDKLIEALGTELSRSQDEIKTKETDEEKAWLKRYELWKKVNIEAFHEG